jgi:hypothetical protein
MSRGTLGIDRGTDGTDGTDACESDRRRALPAGSIAGGGGSRR